MLSVRYSKQFKKDLARMMKRKDFKKAKFERVVGMLADRETLPPRCHDHALENSRNYQNLRECHIGPDWLLVYRIEDDVLTLFLARTGTHSDLF